MTITPTIPGVASKSTPERTAPLPTTEMNAETFMKLFTEQISNQNPMEPMSSADFLNQFSQITSVQSLNQLQHTLTDMKAGIAAAVEALRALREAEALPGGAILLTAHANDSWLPSRSPSTLSPRRAVQGRAERALHRRSCWCRVP